MPIKTPFRLHRAALCCALALAGVSASAQPASVSAGRIYRCGNEYLNDTALAQARGCAVVEGGNVTVVPGTRVRSVPPDSGAARAATSLASVPARGERLPAARSAAEQGVRDNDARAILLAELETAQARLAAQRKEYNNGEPEKLGAESRNHQRYLDRVNELREAIQRYESDIAGLQRELARLPASGGKLGS